MATASQKYTSTRGGSQAFSFEAAVLKGLASDGGLFVPEAIPSLPADWESRWSTLSFEDLAFEIYRLYIAPSEIPDADLKELIVRSYSTFRHPEIAPLKELVADKGLYLLELFHGPTFAFKDVALQFVGNLFEYFLTRKNANVKEGEKRHHLTVVGATSGDTGSAAIYGLRGKKDVSVFILHPKGRVSPIQEAQMTTVLDKNVHNLAVEGTFDDCQDIVKALFSHPELSVSHNLGAINSINWARILAQIVYYFSSYFALKSSDPKPSYVVPTGNFGDILAGYFALRMGLPLADLTIATNENDILHRFLETGKYEKHENSEAAKHGVKATHSPAMDILVSSNFERLLWILTSETVVSQDLEVEQRQAEASKILNSWMNDLKSKGVITVPDQLLQTARATFKSQRVSDPEILTTIKEIFESTGYILDPHSAVGVRASLDLIDAGKLGGKVVSLSTAHPAKFNAAVDLALKGVDAYKGFEEMVRPKEMLGLEDKEKRVRFCKGDVEEVREVVIDELQKEGVNV